MTLLKYKQENRYLEIAREAYEIGFPNVGNLTT